MRYEDTRRLLKALDRLSEISALPGHHRNVTISMVPGYPYVVEIEGSPQATGGTLTVACEKALAYFNPPEPEATPESEPTVIKFAAPLPAGVTDTPEVRKRLQSDLEKETFSMSSLDISKITQALCSNFPVGLQALEASDFEAKAEVQTCVAQVALLDLDDMSEVKQRRQVDIPVGRLIQALLAHPRDSKVFLFGQILAWSANNYDLITVEEYRSLKRSWR